MNKKPIKMILCGILGLLGAAGVFVWPHNASQIQMGLYSVAVLGTLLIGFWSDRVRPNFWKGVGLVLCIHMAVLVLIRSFFPFKTILVVIPIALMEELVGGIVLIRMLGY